MLTMVLVEATLLMALLVLRVGVYFLMIILSNGTHRLVYFIMLDVLMA